jgi:tetratricopeptide (TPR) repeat protein
MKTYFTLEQKYLYAVEEVNYRDAAKGLHLLNQIIEDDPLYARAHYQLGRVYYYDIQDYQSAGFHFKTCMELEPSFPDNYFHYLSLVVFLNMATLVKKVAAKALEVPGVCESEIHNLLGLFAEQRKDWGSALKAYREAYTAVINKEDKEEIAESISRVKEKINLGQVFRYELTG